MKNFFLTGITVEKKEFHHEIARKQMPHWLQDTRTVNGNSNDFGKGETISSFEDRNLAQRAYFAILFRLVEGSR